MPRLGKYSQANGAEAGAVKAQAQADRVGPQQMIDRQEYVRVLQQALRRLGFPAVAERLEQESGVQMQPELVSTFQQAVLAGRYDQALGLLPQLTNHDEATLLQGRFLVLQQKFLEQVQAGAAMQALRTLREEITPLGVAQQELKRLAGHLMWCSDDARNATLQKGPWDGRPGGSRQQLMAALQQQLPPGLLVPEGRLERLLELALESQISREIHHNCPQLGLSLLRDYKAGPEQLPSRLHQVLSAHTDEVWHVQFSHAGDRLASASKDRTAILWDVSPAGTAAARHVLRQHPQAVTHLSWSPDDSMLLTCSGTQVFVWDTASGSRTLALQNHTEHASACIWRPDGKAVLTSGIDRRIFMCDLKGNVLRKWVMGERVNDLAFVAGADVIVCVTADRHIHLMRLSDHVPVSCIGDEAAVGPSAITSISLTPDGEYLLANLRSHTGHLWRVGPVVRRITKPLPDDAVGGHYGLAPEEEGDEEILAAPEVEYHAGEARIGRYVIRSCIGGLGSAFVASGSEDCRLYIWHRDTGRQVAQLEGHSGTVNGVAWNPVHHHMLASASDDRTIGIWVAPLAPGASGSGRADALRQWVRDAPRPAAPANCPELALELQYVP